MGFTYMWVYGFALLILVSIAQTLKYSLKRPRPNVLPNSVRWGLNLRGVEDGTYSMPSGDAMAAACFALFIANTQGFSLIWLWVPLVMLGRVYYHCHWLQTDLRN